MFIGHFRLELKQELVLLRNILHIADIWVEQN